MAEPSLFSFDQISINDRLFRLLPIHETEKLLTFMVTNFGPTETLSGVKSMTAKQFKMHTLFEQNDQLHFKIKLLHENEWRDYKLNKDIYCGKESTAMWGSTLKQELVFDMCDGISIVFHVNAIYCEINILNRFDPVF